MEKLKKTGMVGFALGMMSALPISYMILNKNKIKANKIMNNIMNKAEELTNNMTK